MGNYWLNVLILKIIYPVILAACTIWRPVALSLVYLALMLYSPVVPVPTFKSMNGHTGRYLKTSICLTFLVSLTQFAFHIVLLALPPYGHFLKDCEFLETLLRHLGLVRLDDASVWEVFYWLSPEIIVFPATLLIYIICRKLTFNQSTNDDEASSILPNRKKTEDTSKKIINFLGTIGTYVALASLCLTASLQPSVEGGFYFIIFLGAATWWACNKELHRGFAIVCRLVMIVLIVHIIALLFYQNQVAQEIMPINGTWARYFNFVPIYHTNCSDPRNIEYLDKSDWLTYGYAFRLFWLYYVLALQSQFLCKKATQNNELQQVPTERTPLMRFGSGRTGLLQDSTGSVVVQDGQQDDSIQIQSLSEAQDDNPGIIEHILMAIWAILQLIVNSSYLAANIIMMTWSIMYHSWTTFVLLLWALILWMVPNKRSSMMRCSPFIVFYSTLLLLGQYVYSMNLTEDELPTKIFNINLAELGFSKTAEIGKWHLVVKCLFMTMFWITMRQYTAERIRERQSSVLKDMVGPLHVSVTTATAAMSEDTSEIKSKFMKDFGVLLKKFLTKFWIAVVAIMLFTSGITGERMTVFRIVYMSLFLFFVITFQISWTVWRRIMYGFWITVICYSVIMLILVYTYQFRSFPEYWETKLHIDKQLQMDIGLEEYETKDLFVRLLTPTFFVIISVIQIHYFHVDFLEVTSIEKHYQDGSRRASLGHSHSATSVVPPNDNFQSISEQERTKYTLKQLKQMSKLERLQLIKTFVKHLHHFYDHIWLFLEIHIHKIIFISLILLCINDVCAINFAFVIAVVISINFPRSLQLLAINLMAAAVSVLMVAKMLYQIQYIDHNNWNVNCTSGDDSKNVTYNIAQWIGMTKANPGELPVLLKGYIGIVTVTTFRAIIAVRQWFHRKENNESLDTPQVMFPRITRADADKGLVHCFKFLLNYGFYKFGFEICLMGTTALIGTRLDFYSVLYSVWLLIFFSLKRKTVSRIWPCFKTFAIISLPVQYFFVVAPPTWLCIDYPWESSDMLLRLQEWMYFPDPAHPPNPKKLLCDFILLFMIVRQSLVFRVESRCEALGEEFAAGHNYSVYGDMEKPNFINPVKDYVSHIHNWLDILKRGFMMSLMWITLSIMFLAGTNRTNFFSLGYLIGAFLFLWQGSDLYLRPVKTILKWWNVLIGYCIVVIFCKSILQGIGCVLIQELEQSACWLIQLFGIACLRKFKNSMDVTGFNNLAVCPVAQEDVGMVWDGLCFVFLLMQKRLFKSYYFFHIVDETKAMSILASRGAELLEEIHYKRIVKQENLEKAILQKLKTKMDKIKANQRKIQGPSYRPPAAHKVDALYPASERPLYRDRMPKTNKEAIRSGDYYMFDDLDDDEDDTDLMPLQETLEESERPPHESRRRRMTVSEVHDHTSIHSTELDEDEDQSSRSTKSPKPKKKNKDKDKKDKGGKEDGSTDQDEDQDEEKPKVSLFTYLKFIWAILNSGMVSLTRYLNRFSQDYRYIRKVMAKEKKNLKAKPDFRRGMRLGINQIWQPIPIIKQRSLDSESREKEVESEEGTDEALSNEQLEDSAILQAMQGHLEEEAELSEVDQPPIIQLAASIWFGILAHSTLLCYFMVFLHQIKNASVLSIPLPLMVFLWGSLTVPRPSKTFWVTLIAYTEIVVIIKCIFQLELIPWNQTYGSKNPLFAPRIIGIERQINYALWDLLLLLMMFFHRFMLKSLGQWTTSSITPRKIIPSPIGLAAMRQDSTESQSKELKPQVQLEKDRTGEENNGSVDFRTPQGHSLSTYQDLDEVQTAPPDEDEKIVIVQAEQVQDKFPNAVGIAANKYTEPIQIFFKQILTPSGKEKTNVYAYMFLCDFFNFLLLIFGFSAFGTQQGDGGVTTYFQENRVPMPFLLMLLLQFALIVVDRALYLRKSMFGKLVFQYFLVLGVHVWMFFILPSVTERAFNDNLPPQIWYMMKCFYLLLAAYQLRLGYPTRILGNFLCKKYTVVNYVLFKGFMFVPFLFELRAVMDWIWTDTSMSIMDWFKMEDIFASIYQIKCMRGVETDFPQPRGVKKNQISKYFVGGGALFLMIGLIWFPLLLFALGGTVGVSNIPFEVSMKLGIGPYDPIYTMTAQNSSIFRYSEEDYTNLLNIYSSDRSDRSAVTFLENYINTDVAAVKLSNSSGRFWEISPPDRERLIQYLESDDIVTIHVEWTVSRKTDAKDSSGVTTTIRDIRLPPYVDGQFNLVRRNLSALISPTQSENENEIVITLEHVFPKFLKVTSRTTSPVPQLMKSSLWQQLNRANPDENEEEDDDDYLYRNISLRVSTSNYNCCVIQQWWVIREEPDIIYTDLLSKIPMNNRSDDIMMFLFNDKAFPESLSFISGFGILGLYTTAVIVISQMMRKIVSDMAPKIMFDDLPYVDRILRLCLDVYLVRESGDLCLEEDLFAKLIFLYRSPETLIRWTRPPEPQDRPRNESDDEIEETHTDSSRKSPIEERSLSDH